MALHAGNVAIIAGAEGSDVRRIKAQAAYDVVYEKYKAVSEPFIPKL